MNPRLKEAIKTNNLAWFDVDDNLSSLTKEDFKGIIFHIIVMSGAEQKSAQSMLDLIKEKLEHMASHPSVSADDSITEDEDKFELVLSSKNKKQLFDFYNAYIRVYEINYAELNDKQKQNYQANKNNYVSQATHLSIDILADQDTKLKKTIMDELSEFSQSWPQNNRLLAQYVLYQEAIKDKKNLKEKILQLAKNQNVFAMIYSAEHYNLYTSSKLALYTYVAVATTGSASKNYYVVNKAIEEFKSLNKKSSSVLNIFSKDSFAKLWALNFFEFLQKNPEIVQNIMAKKIDVHSLILTAMSSEYESQIMTRPWTGKDKPDYQKLRLEYATNFVYAAGMTALKTDTMITFDKKGLGYYKVKTPVEQLIENADKEKDVIATYLKLRDEKLKTEASVSLQNIFADISTVEKDSKPKEKKQQSPRTS